LLYVARISQTPMAEVQLQPVRAAEVEETVDPSPRKPPKRPPSVDRHDQEIARLHNKGKPHGEHTLDERLRHTKHAVFRLPRDVGDLIKFPPNRGLEGTTEPGSVAELPTLMCQPDTHVGNQDIEKITYPGVSAHISAFVLEDHVGPRTLHEDHRPDRIRDECGVYIDLHGLFRWQARGVAA